MLSAERRRCLSLACGLFACGLLTGCESSILSPIGPVGAGERIILLDSLIIMLAVGVPTMVVAVVFALWFRPSNARARRRPGWAYSGRLEIIVWSIPALVILFLGGIAWISAHELDPSEPLPSKTPPLQVDVVSLDWKWLFIYPAQGVASVNRLVAPVGVPLQLKITSASVFNAFFIPQLGSMIYAMHGMQAPLNLQADRAGHYLGLSTHFSGDGFPDMKFDFNAVTAAQFATWLAATRAQGAVLDADAYHELLRQSRHVAPYTYRAVAPDLFDRIVAMREPEGQGPSQ